MGRKKKNKVASNPARGFATTSVPSKANAPAPVPEDPTERGIDTLVASESSDQRSGKSDEIPRIPNEDEMEERRLEVLVEKLGQRVKKETRRIVTKVEVEKRTVRSTCYPLKVNELLEFGFVGYNNQSRTTGGVKELGVGDQVLALAREEFLQFRRGNETECKRGETLLLNAWTLQKTFISMGFPKGKVEEGLQALADHGSAVLDKEKGLDGALEEMFDWLALNCEEEELPGFYDESGKGKKKDVFSGSSDLTPSETKPDSGTSTPRQPFGADRRHLTGQLRQVAGWSLESRDVSGEGEMVGNNECDHSEDEDVEIAPEELIPQYLKLQTQKYHLHPASTIVTGRKVKGKKEVKASSIAGASPAKAEQLNKIQRKLGELARDPLFDIREAEDVWRVERLRLEKEEWAKRKSGEGSTFKKGTKFSVGDTVNSEGGEDKEETESASPIDSSHTGEDSDMDLEIMGGLFESPPTEESTVAPGGENEKVAIRDFELVNTSGGNFGKGKPKGKAGVGTPTVKKVLEELCRSRDVNSKIRFEVIPGTSISARSKLTITWSSIAESSSVDVSPVTPTLEGVLPPVIISTPGLLCTTFSMASVAAMSKDQADGFIATYALFKLCVKKDEKIYYRLPSIWRELWFELLNEGQLESGRQEREVLRHLEKTLKIENFGLSGPNDFTERKARVAKAVGPSEQGTTIRGVGPEGVISDAIKKDWLYRTNRSGYRQMLEHRRRLPMGTFKKDVLAAVENNQVIIICGETGCGKSTQTPAFILERELSQGKACRIYCTEPRRISAISLARRVSEELGERKSEVGSRNSLVGYAIRLESRMHAGTRLIYATTGIVMRMLERSPELEEVTHLVLDEVHERSIDSDFLLLVLKKLLVQRKNLKVVLMSATVDADRLSAYLGGAPVMRVPGRTFPVETYYLEDAIRLTQFTVEDDARGSRNQVVWEDDDEGVELKNIAALIGELRGYPSEIKDTLCRLDLRLVNYELIVRLIDFVGSSPEYVDYSKAILVFMPGFAEIRRLNDMLMAHPTFGNNRGNGGWLIYLLHSTIASEDQEAAFSIPPSGMRKIVIATNIAETGITIPDITCVIDTGRHKEMRFDERRQLSRLVETFVSRANAKQRRGRAGRVQKGLCFHLFTKNQHNNWIAEEQTPEIMRLSLQDLVLRIKICKLGQIEEVLSQALDAPLPKNIRRAIDSLLEVKALTVTEELTALGRQLAKLPLDVYLGKLVLMGSIYGCLDAALTIAAILSSKSPFVTPLGHKKEAESCRLSFKRADSDLLTGWNAYSSWRRVCQRKTMVSENEFCQKNYLSSRNLVGIEELKQQLIVSVVEARFLTLKEEEKAELNRCRFSTYYRRRFFIVPESVNHNSENDSVVNSVIAASFYPKLVTKGDKGWRNILNNHNIAVHPGSVNRHTNSEWLAFHSIMQSNRSYDAHETSHVDSIAVALLCGDVDYKMHAGAMILDGHRAKFSFEGWKSLVAFKILRSRLKEITARSFRVPGKELTEYQTKWMQLLYRVFLRLRQIQEERAGGGAD